VRRTTRDKPAGWRYNCGMTRRGVQRKIAAVLVAGVLAAGAGVAAAAAGTIDFDGVTVPSLFAETIRTTNEFERLGVVFAGPGGLDGLAVLTEAGNFHVSGHSPANFLAWNHTAIMSDGGRATGPETLTFAQSAHSVSLRAGCSFGGELTATGLDPSGKKLGEVKLVLSAELKVLGLPWTNIRSILLDLPPGEYGVIDDLRFATGRPAPTATGLGTGAWMLRPDGPW